MSKLENVSRMVKVILLHLKGYQWNDSGTIRTVIGIDWDNDPFLYITFGKTN